MLMELPAAADWFNAEGHFFDGTTAWYQYDYLTKKIDWLWQWQLATIGGGEPALKNPSMNPAEGGSGNLVLVTVWYTLWWEHC